MIKRTLLTGFMYLAMISTFIYSVACFVQWEIIYIPPINDWTNEERMVFFWSYVSTCIIAFVVEMEIRDKKKREAEEFARDLKRRSL